MVVIRLARSGSKKKPFYHFVAADRRDPRDGRFIERLGYFNPMARGQETRIEIDKERIDHWVSQGARPSERVAYLLKLFIKQAGKPMEAAPTKSEMKRIQQEVAMVAAKKRMEVAKKAEAEEKVKAEAEASAKAAEEKKAAEAKPEEAPEAKAEEAPKKEAAPEAKAEEAPKKEAVPEAKAEEAPKKEAAPEAKAEEAPKKAALAAAAKKDDSDKG